MSILVVIVLSVVRSMVVLLHSEIRTRRILEIHFFKALNHFSFGNRGRTRARKMTLH